MQHEDSHLRLLPAITRPHFSSYYGLNQNSPWHNRDCTQHITHILWYKKFYSLWPLTSLQQISLLLFTTHPNHSSSFNSPTLTFNNFFRSEPHIVKRSESWIPSLSKYPGSVFCLIQSNFFQPSSWPWHHSALTHLMFCRRWGHFRAKTLVTSFTIQ